MAACDPEWLPSIYQRHLPTQAPFSLVGPGITSITSQNQFTTTYATTYGWVSAGIRRELTAPPPRKKRLDGTKRDPTGLNRWTERLATNQKVAGSSPAERAPESRIGTRDSPFTGAPARAEKRGCWTIVGLFIGFRGKKQLPHQLRGALL